MKPADVVLSNLLAKIDELTSDPEKIAVEPGKDFTRNRKLGANNLIRMLLTMEAECINEELYTYFGYTKEVPTKAAFCKQRCKLNQNALPFLLRQFNKTLSEKFYNEKYRFLACDGSGANIFRNPDDPDTYYPPSGRSKNGVNLIHINALYDITNRRIVDILVQPGRKKNEYSAFCHMVDAFGNDGVPTVYFGDRGFASYNNFAHVIENGNFFLIRCNDCRLQRILGHSIENLQEMDGWFDRILTRNQSSKKYSRPELSDNYRYVCPGVPFDYISQDHPEYDIKLHIIRFELSPGCFENNITNLPDDEFDFEDFKYLYFLCWGGRKLFQRLEISISIKFLSFKKISVYRSGNLGSRHSPQLFYCHYCRYIHS